METAIINEATQAIEAFLNRRNCTIITTGWALGNDRINFIAEDDDGKIAFVTANIAENTDDGFPKEFHRDPLERVTIAWLTADFDITDRAVRFN